MESTVISRGEENGYTVEDELPVVRSISGKEKLATHSESWRTPIHQDVLYLSIYLSSQSWRTQIHQDVLCLSIYLSS